MPRDPTAILDGPWEPNLTFPATVRIKSVDMTCFHEVEPTKHLHLFVKDRPSRARFTFHITPVTQGRS
jgi:hypothetical protein